MDLISLVIVVVVLGLVWWLVTTYLPMPPAGKTVLTVAFAVVMVLALLSFLGIGASVLHYRPGLR
ncbi:MAG TPA: Thivi_2564 family membrane protein [Burkholderiaceae bacterium]|nr:Thivi_2564 family membrane protein [Burkholderiaceae bacterium]